jgi:branched-chain amino acid transport system ATP-binding protein
MSNPDVLMLDEISLGLSPAAVDLVYASLNAIKSGTTIILVEQELSRVMKFATRIVCMLEGQFVLDRATHDVTRDEITAAYFGKGRGAH